MLSYSFLASFFSFQFINRYSTSFSLVLWSHIITFHLSVNLSFVQCANITYPSKSNIHFLLCIYHKILLFKYATITICCILALCIFTFCIASHFYNFSSLTDANKYSVSKSNIHAYQPTEKGWHFSLQIFCPFFLI